MAIKIVEYVLLDVSCSGRNDIGGSGQMMCLYTHCHQIFTVHRPSQSKPSTTSLTSENGRLHSGLLNACLSYMSEQLPCTLSAKFWRNG